MSSIAKSICKFLAGVDSAVVLGTVLLGDVLGQSQKVCFLFNFETRKLGGFLLSICFGYIYDKL